MKPCLWLFLIALLSMTLTIHAETKDSRVLQLDTGSETFSLTVNDLTAIGLTDVTVDYDLDFPNGRSYKAVALSDILMSVNMPFEGTLLLVCEDGYTLPLDLELLNDPSINAYIALSDNSTKSVGNWQPYKHGREWISLDPFYLVWTGTAKDFAQRAKKLPWPFQLSAMTVSDSELYSSIQPKDTASQQVKRGYELFVDNCIKCHSVNDVGGALAPALSSDSGLISTMDKDALTDFILHIDRYYSETAMPVFEQSLSKEQVYDIVDFLKTR
jgi:mono/diheme cytochrome c family protein